MKVKSEREVAQSCPTLSSPMDWDLPGSSVHGIFQARVLEWGAIAFSDSVTSHLHWCYTLRKTLSELEKWVYLSSDSHWFWTLVRSFWGSMISEALFILSLSFHIQLVYHIPCHRGYREACYKESTYKVTQSRCQHSCNYGNQVPLPRNCPRWP